MDSGITPVTGGSLLGQGVYGCTFDPAPRCAGGPVFSRIGGLPAVGKVTSEDVTEELGIGKEIMALPLATAYFALPSKECKTETPIRDPDVTECKVMEEAGSGSKFTTLIMPAAGEQLYKYAMDLRRLSENYLRMFIHLLEGACIYQDAGYVHNDIHMGNILVDERGVARYIDFGLAFRVEDVREWGDANLGSTFKPEYIWQAPEVHAWRLMLGGIRLADGVKQLQDKNPEYLQLEHQFPSRKRCLDAIRDFMLSSKAVAREDGGAFVRAYGKRFDSWRIGLCMWFLWDDLLRSPGFTSTGLYGKRDLVRSALGGLTDFDPRARLSVAAALLLLDPGNRLGSSSSSSS
jgi:serine/threonine protein kinase